MDLRPLRLMKYELLYIVPSSFSDTEIEGVQKEVAALVAQEGGTVIRDESLGKIKLAYPIKKVRHGTYIMVQFEAETTILNPLEAKLRLEDKIIRHLVTAMPAGAENKVFEIASYVAPLSAEGKRQDKPVRQAKPAPAVTAPISSEPATEEKAGQEAKPELAPPAPSKPEETTPKMSVEELDKKLDEILESDDLNDI